MASPARSQVLVSPDKLSRRQGAKDVLKDSASGELVFGVVGHIGSGASEVAEALQAKLQVRGFEVHILKARDEILAWAHAQSKNTSQASATVAQVSALQDWGDEMRELDPTAVAIALVRAVRRARASSTRAQVVPGMPVVPDTQPRAYILDSIRHPAEAELLRELYRSAFVLVGVVCEEEERESRLSKKYKDAGSGTARELMERDANADKPWGQHVQDVFHTADVFLDNTAPRFTDAKKRVENKAWTVPDQLSRLVKILVGTEVIRPTVHEFSMYAAYGAKMSSACLSKQVGAALVDRENNLIATGTNEVPRAGGGVFAGVGDGLTDYRCAHNNLEEPFCSNTREQRENIQLVLEAIPNSRQWSESERLEIERKLAKTPLGQALEFSRAVHAEMDAVLTASRAGARIVGSTLYTTTFPCHYCARHLVAAGVYEVQYVEPYPKSRALKLHPDTLTTSAEDWVKPDQPGGKVLIRPFTGVAPRLYRRAFLKVADLKGENGVMKIGVPEWSHPWQLRKVGYPELEAKLAQSIEDEGLQK